ncbi:hypothetical protein V6N12_028746 [Hibiscus sabdariffa]|uniref:Uncharacterized protein n=1 Tax=Hibiscus sabdariffa TaxID=183260 RepID=A0ABR2F6R5_9ROSI
MSAPLRVVSRVGLQSNDTTTCETIPPTTVNQSVVPSTTSSSVAADQEQQQPVAAGDSTSIAPVSHQPITTSLVFEQELVLDRGCMGVEQHQSAHNIDGEEHEDHTSSPALIHTGCDVEVTVNESSNACSLQSADITNAPASNAHSMITRSKRGIFKPKDILRGFVNEAKNETSSRIATPNFQQQKGIPIPPQVVMQPITNKITSNVHGKARKRLV